MRHLKASIARLVDRKAALTRASELVFGLAKRDLDPELAVLLLGATTARRMWYKHAHLQPIFTMVLQSLHEKQCPGTVGGRDLGEGDGKLEGQASGPI
eukprot:13409115-Alexandrium_andersonii.AAC.1